MSAGMFIALAMAGGTGAALRLFLDGVIRERIRSDRGRSGPLATALINLTGSFLLGLVAGAAASSLLPETWHQILGAGFLGGYTTFSTASVDTVRLIKQRRWRAGIGYGVGVLVGAVVLAGSGLLLGSAWSA